MKNTATLAMALLCLLASLQCSFALLPVPQEIESGLVKWNESEESSEKKCGENIWNIVFLFKSNLSNLNTLSGSHPRDHTKTALDNHNISPETPPPDFRLL